MVILNPQLKTKSSISRSFGKIYQQQAQQQGQQAGGGQQNQSSGYNDDNVVDADYEVVDDEE